MSDPKMGRGTEDVADDPTTVSGIPGAATSSKTLVGMTSPFPAARPASAVIATGAVPAPALPGDAPLPPRPGSTAYGTLQPGTPQPATTHPHTIRAQSRGRPVDATTRVPTGGSEVRPRAPTSRSKWDTYDAAPTDVHPQSTAPHVGAQINHYEIIKVIGEGGMGKVFLARDLRLGRRVAIKFLQTDQPDLTQRFLVEARTTARCQHDNIVVIYDVGEYGGAPYIVLEFLNGQPLTAAIKNEQRLPYSRAVEIMCAIVRALQCAHEANIVHRDLKPDNVFITDAGTVKVLDFGIAKILQDKPGGGPIDRSAGGPRMPNPIEMVTGTSNGLTNAGIIMGTLPYMSPEQWGIGIEIDHLTDIWAAGILLHQMICGRHPLHLLEGSQLMVTGMLELPMPSMAEAAPSGVPRELIQIVDRCLRKHKDQRWQSAAELLAALTPFLPGHRAKTFLPDESPYAGLASFQESDAGKFFGRNREIAAMVTRIRDRPLIAVVGSSGVGKSSFVRAGLVPALKRSGELWETLVIRPGRSPFDALATAIQPMVATATNLADDLDEQRKLAETLRRQPGQLGHVLRGRARRDGRRLLLFVDQFEELYTQVADPAERAAFTACLSGVADDATSPLRVVLSIRSDFVDRVAEDQQFVSELTQGLFFLGPPDRDGLRDAIANPAEMAGFTFEVPAIVDDMLDHLETTPGALPLLQFAAAALWETRDQSRRMLTLASYSAMGGVAGALASHADRVVGELGPHKASLIRAVLLRLVTAERTRAIVPIAELRELSREAGEVQLLVDQMVAARLLVVQTLEGGRGSTVEIVHESLLHGWPTLRRWLDENQDDAALVDQLRLAARQWAAKGHDAGVLWRGDTAEEAKRFRKRYQGPLLDVERGFLDAVVDLELSAQRRKRRTVIGGFVMLSALVVGAVALAVVFQRASARDKQQNAEITRAKQAAEHALAEVTATEQRRKAAQATADQTTTENKALGVVLSDREKDLEAKNAELKDLYDEARRSEDKAKAATVVAEKSANEAKKAKEAAEAATDEALKAKREAEHLRDEEKARRIAVEKTKGSVIDDDLCSGGKCGSASTTEHP